MGENEAAVLVIEFDLGEGETFQRILRLVSEAVVDDDRIHVRGLHAGVRETAQRVMAAFETPAASNQGEGAAVVGEIG